jgi:predicted SAM-dependent methyltransferase
VIKLHIGGTQAKEGWSILNIQPGPGVDYVGTCEDLSFLGDGSCSEVYASHVLEHVSYQKKLQASFKELYRVLAPGGRLRLSVPNFELLCGMFLGKDLDFQGRITVMRIIFGGQLDPFDFHCVGLWPELVDGLLREAGFKGIAAVEPWSEFEDTSSARFAGKLVSYNVEAFK